MLSGKVEEGQGPRAELTQAAAEELRVPVARVRLVLADKDLVPDDGITAGSRTTPRNVPEMRQAGATARELLTGLAAREWKVDATTLEVRDGAISSPTGRTMTYADVARVKDAAAILGEAIRSDVTLTPVLGWNRDVPPAGGGETPIIAVAPAIGNAVFAATGVRLRSMPLRGEGLRKA